MTTRRDFLRNSALGTAAVTAAPASLILNNNDADKLKIGIAREIITPKLGGFFAGYGSNIQSNAVHDDLTVTALAIEQGKIKVMLISATILYVDNKLSDRLRTLCGEAAGVPAANVILAFTHTHSGPVITTEYSDEILIPKCVAAAKASVKTMKPVTVGIATTETRVGINRREILPDNKVILGQNPWGPYDSEMTVISFKGENGKSIANIVHCTAHCTATGQTTLISRDWAGVMVDRLEQESDGITLFFQGMQGDIAPRKANNQKTRSNIAHAMEVGGVAALDAIRAYKDIRVYRDEELSVVTGEVRLPYAPVMPLEEARSELEKLEASTPGRWTEDFRRILTRMIELHEKGETGESYFVYDQTLVRIGPIVFIPVPFEASCEISFRLRAYSKYGHTLALGCTNGSNSYLVTQDQICRGGYEVERFRWSGPRLADNADIHLISENLKLVEKL